MLVEAPGACCEESFKYPVSQSRDSSTVYCVTVQTRTLLLHDPMTASVYVTNWALCTVPTFHSCKQMSRAKKATFWCSYQTLFMHINFGKSYYNKYAIYCFDYAHGYNAVSDTAGLNIPSAKESEASVCRTKHVWKIVLCFSGFWWLKPVYANIYEWMMNIASNFFCKENCYMLCACRLYSRSDRLPLSALWVF